jgi:methyl-accepting chemotaxis protein
MIKNTNLYNRPSVFNRQFLIQKRFQKKFMITYVGAVLLVVLSFMIVLHQRIESAVESHLYRTHIHIEKVGDFLIDLLFQINFYAILAIVLIVILLSLTFFHKINKKFDQLGEAVERMGRGEGNALIDEDQSWSEIGSITLLLNSIQEDNDDRFAVIENALDMLEAGCAGAGDVLMIKNGKDELDQVLQSISIT